MILINFFYGSYISHGGKSLTEFIVCWGSKQEEIKNTKKIVYKKNIITFISRESYILRLTKRGPE